MDPLNNLEEHILILNKEGIITYSNHSLNVKLSTLDIDPGDTRYSFVHIYGKTSEVCIGIKNILNGNTPKFIYEFQHSEQEQNWFIIKAEPIVAIENGERIIDGAIVLYFNITIQKKLEQALRRSEEKYRLIAENSRDLIKVIDLNGNIEYASPSHESILGYHPNGYLGRVVYESVHPDDSLNFNTSIKELSSNKEPVVVELRKLHKEGHWIWLEASCSPILAFDGSVQSIVILTRDITERKEYEEKLENMAYHDFLTGLYNRRKFTQMIEKALQQATETNKKIAFLMMDLNKFKSINDNLGHDSGDVALQEFSKRLMNCKRDGDILGRLSGDEFAMLMNDITDEKEIYEMINLISSSLEVPCILKNEKYNIATSIGVSVFPTHGNSAPPLMKCADIALYHAKTQGERNYCFYSE